MRRLESTILIRADPIYPVIWSKIVGDIETWVLMLRIGGSKNLFENGNGSARRVGITNIIRTRTRILIPIGRVGSRGVSIIVVCLVVRVVDRLAIEPETSVLVGPCWEFCSVSERFASQAGVRCFFDDWFVV